MKNPLKVMLWGEEVGRLVWDKNSHNTYFMYTPTFLQQHLDIAPFTAPVKGIKSRLPIYGEDAQKYQKLPAFLADSLPDDWGNQLFERWRIDHKISNVDLTPLEKLSFIGRRGMGALEFVPEVPDVSTSEQIEIQSLIELSQRFFSEREEAHILPEEKLTMQSLIAVGTSAGGRQPKAILAVHPETGEIRSGQVDGLDGYEYCILKFGDSERSSAELEMVYYEMCRLSGINMMASKLLEVQEKKHFLTLRFDRQGVEKLHTQTLAALCPGTVSYEQLLTLCRRMRLPETDSEEIFRRMVFNVLSNNTDDHDRNFSFIMDKAGKWRIAPAYDVTYIFNMGGYQPQENRCLMVRGKLTGITKKDVLEFAKENGIRGAESIIGEVVKALLSFRKLALQYGVKEEWINRIESTLISNLQDWGYSVLDDKNSPCDEWYLWGHKISHVRMETAYKGNYHLWATIDDKDLKYIFRKGTEEYNDINATGIAHLEEELLLQLVRTYLLPKVDK